MTTQLGHKIRQFDVQCPECERTVRAINIDAPGEAHTGDNRMCLFCQ